MGAGPFDQRKHRSRCIACSSSHLKCSGGIPCHNCARRGKFCELPVRDLSITLDSKENPGKASSGTALSSQSFTIRNLTMDTETIYVLAFFKDFLPRNNFTGRLSSPWLTIHGHLSSHKSLVNIICAIGALQRAKHHESIDRNPLSDAFRCYTSAITTLRNQITRANNCDLLQLSWSTFLLGLFELMCDDSGQGWVWHMLYGTTRILQSLTPDSCRYGAGREFFLEIRIFEIARSMLFGEKSFLSTKPWIDLMQEMWLGDYASEWSPRERLLDIMTLASDLCIRVVGYTRSNIELHLEDGSVRALVAFAEEGHRLRSDLSMWEDMAQLWPTSSKKDHQMTVAWIFHSAISIYLSGVYDYDQIWSIYHIATPGLPQVEIEKHVSKILECTSFALEDTNVTALVFLFPLRIAGARATTIGQREQIRSLLAQISCNFRVADAIASDLAAIWARRASNTITST